MGSAPVASPHDLRSDHGSLADHAGPRAVAATVNPYPFALRGILIAIAAVVPFWAIATAIIWRLVSAH